MRKLSISERISVKLSFLKGLFQTRGTQPYIITVSNSSTESVKDFDIFGAYKYLDNKDVWKDGSITINGVTISSGISHISYQQFLSQSMNQPFEVGLTHIQAISGSTAQLVERLTIDTQDDNGNRLMKAIIPLMSPYQSRNDVIQLEQSYGIDGLTRLTINKIYPSAVFNMSFFLNHKVEVNAGTLVKECASLLWLAIRYLVSKSKK